MKSRLSRSIFAAMAALPLLMAGCGDSSDSTSVSLTRAAVSTQQRDGGGGASNSQNDESSMSAPNVQQSPSADNGNANSAASAGRMIEATFDDIKFDMELTDEFDVSMLTDKVESLFDESIRIRGYMLPTMRRQGIKQFVLVRDNQECCFGPGAALYDCILVQMAEGTTVAYSIRPVAVEGVFRFQELKDPKTNRHLAIYRLEGKSVE